MKTALQQLIEQFEKAKDQADKKADFISMAYFSYTIKQAEYLLQTEREQIEKAYSCGGEDMDDRCFIDSAYYDKTYGDESTSGNG